MVNPSVVDGRRGGWGRHCPLFHVLRRFKILCGPGEAGKLMEQGQLLHGMRCGPKTFLVPTKHFRNIFGCPQSISKTFLDAHGAFFMAGYHLIKQSCPLRDFVIPSLPPLPAPAAAVLQQEQVSCTVSKD